MAGGIIVLALFFVAIFAPLVSPYNPNDIDRKHILDPPDISILSGPMTSAGTF